MNNRFRRIHIVDPTVLQRSIDPLATRLVPDAENQQRAPSIDRQRLTVEGAHRDGQCIDSTYGPYGIEREKAPISFPNLNVLLQDIYRTLDPQLHLNLNFVRRVLEQV